MWQDSAKNLYYGTYTQGNPCIYALIPESTTRKGQWFFVYNGYSSELKKYVSYVQFEDGAVSFFVLPNIVHSPSNYFGFNIGVDQFYPAWQGEYKYWSVQFGPQSFPGETKELFNTFKTIQDQNVMQKG